MFISTEDIRACKRLWSLTVGAEARASARAILRADARRANAAPGTTWALDRMVRAYLSEPPLRSWLEALPAHAQSAGRALLTRRFFRAAAGEPGHHVVDYMVASFARFNGLVAATVDVPPEHLDEIIWADLAAWVLQSLAKWRTAYIPATPTTSEEIEDAPPAVHTLDERLNRLLAPVDAASDPLLERYRRSLEAVFGRAVSVPRPPHTDPALAAAGSDAPPPTANAAGAARGHRPSTSSDRARREPAGSGQQDHAAASCTVVAREFWWDAGRKSFEELTRSEVLGQVFGTKRFLGHGFMYSPAGRALQAFASARIVNRIVYTVECQHSEDPHRGTGHTSDAAAASPLVDVCRHRRHVLRYAEQPVACGCEQCERTARIRRVQRWMVVTAPEYGHFSRASICREAGCRRVAPDTSPACGEPEPVDVWVPATPVSLDALVNVHEDDGRRVIDRVAAGGPPVIERLMTAERIDPVAVKQLDAEIRERALGLRETVRTLLRRELREAETATWKRLAVLAALFPDLGSAAPHAWEIRLLTNVLREFPRREAAIEQLPARLRRLGCDVPPEWHTEPLTATNFGKLKSEMAKRWRQREPLLQRTATELLDPSLTETLDDIDEVLHRSRE